jgi:hypothetical protein
MPEMRQTRDWWLISAFGLLAIATIIGYLRHGRHAGQDVHIVDDQPFSQMSYRGHPIKLSRTYRDFDEYKNDENNIDPAEIGLVQKLVMDAPVARVYHSREQYIRDSMDWTFPGYGSTAFGAGPQDDGSTISMESEEIPKANRDRYLVFRWHGETGVLLDDFIYDDSKMLIAKVRIENGQLSYYSPANELIFKHPLPPDQKP